VGTSRVRDVGLRDRVCLWHFSDIEPARFNVRFRALFGHQRMPGLGRRVTESGRNCKVTWTETDEITAQPVQSAPTDGQVLGEETTMTVT
jgi:hypothetical protein